MTVPTIHMDIADVFQELMSDDKSSSSGLPTNTLYAFLDLPIRATCPAHLKRLDLMFLIMSGYSTTSQYLSGRLVHLTTYLTAVVLLTSYSASLISSITIGPHGVPFGSFEDFLSDGTYSLAVMANSYAVTYFKLTHPGKGDRYRFTWNFQDFGEKYGFMVRLIFSEEAAFHLMPKLNGGSNYYLYQEGGAPPAITVTFLTVSLTRSQNVG
ncbi:hypothetical protein ANN_00841 [Periplaneta americana]|uniref:Uncharacterized protein n=1 Tax=Periplaneta americana TaxID=6978 RepID=A0ABQ8TRY9_PERAM|nr:hypothetical protein ANN_00841 [Periplaneta americana]